MRRWAAGLLVVGVALIVVYFVLKSAHVGKVGAPTDIGGGFIALSGYALAATGAILLLVDIRGGGSSK